MYLSFGKRCLDVILSALLFLIFLPVFLMVWIILFWINNRKPFFFQDRPGIGNSIFKIIKFKTMRDAFDSEGNPLPDAERLTQVGNLIRKTSLDELPQLINVIKGDMSFVGPRPLLVEYLPLYNPYQILRHRVKPGITGWAQVNGRNAISWEEKFELDVTYVQNLSLVFDFKILVLTVWNVIQGKGISQEGQISMKKFEGNPP